MAGVQVEGLARMQRTLRRAGQDIGDFKKLHREVGRIVSRAGKATAPRRSGALKRTVRAGATNRAATVRAGNKGGVPYAGVIHWGWPAHNITAQPFLSDAATSTEAQWIGNYMQHIDSTLKKVKGL